MGSIDFEPEYLAALDEIYHSGWAAGKRRRMAVMSDAVAHFWPEGHPSRLVHVTGTNGKGSVCHGLAQTLRFAGSTGSWTGPHVFDYAERFHINGEVVAHDALVSVFRDRIVPYQNELARRDEHLSFAETGILIALLLFERYGVRWGLLEVGAGGRHTPLMALDVDACILTNVGDDHPQSLGAELWQRCLAKAGIARKGVPFFSGADGDARDFVKRTARSRGAKWIEVGPTERGETASLLGCDEDGYEARNMALIIKVVKYFYPDRAARQIYDGIEDRLTCRFFEYEPDIIVDIAHNRNKIEALSKRIKEVYPGRRCIFLVGLTRSRDPVDVFRPLLGLAERMIVSSASYPGQDPDEVAAKLRAVFPVVEVVEEPTAAFEYGRTCADNGQLLIVTGSAYLIDQALNANPYLAHLNRHYGWRNRS